MPGRSIALLILRTSTAVLALVLSAGTPAAGEIDPRDREIALLKKRTVALRQQVVVDQVEIDRLKQELAELKAALATPHDAQRRTVEPEPIGPAIVAQPAIESSDLQVDPIPTEPLRPEGPTMQAGIARTDDLQAVYDEGYTLFHQKRYQDAEARFASFLARSDDSDLADNAQFWIGECRYARDDYAAALEAFTTVVERYPKGNKVPDAMVKAGKTLEAMGDPDAARTTYREVRSRFPGTAAAATAEELLARLH